MAATTRPTIPGRRRAPAAETRYWSATIWSGSGMIVWGGCDAQTCGPGGNSDRNGLNNGGRY
ncbi:MAG: hypothetical protein M3032_10645, partial [Verrucomicrobiota bacterium]|nr:hypothetical protein [Verrucomicrobiota bacterium]